MTGDGSKQDILPVYQRRTTCLLTRQNSLFQRMMRVIKSTMTSSLHFPPLSKLIIVIGVTNCDDDNMEAEHLEHKHPHLYAVGAEVMLTANLWTEVGLVNGACASACGTVVAILKPEDNRKLYILMVNIPSYHGPALSPSHPTVVPITHITTRNFSGISLTLAWAITIHKSQGMSLEHVTVDLGETEFSSGLTFVALSRAQSFHGLRIMPFDFNGTAALPTAHMLMRGVQRCCGYDCWPKTRTINRCWSRYRDRVNFRDLQYPSSDPDTLNGMDDDDFDLNVAY
jgi:hypothetical protein